MHTRGMKFRAPTCTVHVQSITPRVGLRRTGLSPAPDWPFTGRPSISDSGHRMTGTASSSAVLGR
ncbi:MAG: hypothetical protein WCC38_14655 [Pseudonocardiaceae bacterium]